jgi:hypothetical protein
MKGEEITQILAQFFEFFEKIELKNANLFFNELIVEKLQFPFNNQLKIIDTIKIISEYAQKFKEVLLSGENLNLREFTLKLNYLKKELDEYLSTEHFDD